MKHFDIYRTRPMSARPTVSPSYARASLWNMLSDVDDFFDRGMTKGDENESTEVAFTPRANIEETKEAYLLHFDLPGVKKEDLKIDVHGRTLTVSGERKREVSSEATGYRRFESVSGKFSRSFTVPEGVDATRVDAALMDGVLKVTLPKSEEQKPRTIQVK